MDNQSNRLWCPLGRVSIQRFEAGQFREAVPGAYNQVHVVDRLKGETGATVHAATICMKEKCALYRKPLFWKQPGACGLLRPDYGCWILAALVVVEILAIAATAIFKTPGLLP